VICGVVGEPFHARCVEATWWDLIEDHDPRDVFPLMSHDHLATELVVDMMNGQTRQGCLALVVDR
jgi:hypothetical protein